ncbi:MAG TPA: PAS domain S-box protein [Syntrophorhabdaceae bacterium]|nr:PAS domain S-box protein [Syntrophorhabdaceae bacterium]
MDLSNKYPFFEEKENRIYKDIEGLKNILLEGKNVQKGIEFLNILKKEFETLIKIHKDMDQTLQAIEKKYREIIDNPFIGLYTSTVEGRLLWVNKTLSDIHGFGSPEEMIESITDIGSQICVNQEDRKRLIEQLKEKGYVNDFEMCCKKKDGSYIWLLITAKALYDEKGDMKYIEGTIIDITKRKMAEKALEESERKYRSIFENAIEGFFQTTPDGRFIDANPALARMFGYYSPKEMMEEIKNLEDHYANPEDRKRMKELYERDGYIIGFETQFYRRDHSKIWIRMNGRAVKDDYGNILYYEGTTEDITDRIEAEKALKESEERYRSVIENSNEGIAIIKAGIFLFVNKKFVEMFGYKNAEEVIGRDILTTVHEDDKNFVKYLARKREEGTRVMPQYEFKGVKKNGEIIYIEISVGEVFFYGERFIIAFLRDITDRKQLEAQLIQSQKMEAIGQLAGGVAHDFNNILTAIIGYADLLEMKLSKDDRLKHYVQQILTSANRAAQLTQGLLTFSRKQIMHLKPVDLNKTIVNFKGMLERIIGEDIELKIHLREENITIVADPVQIEQILMNLATNARDAMPDGGTLTIEAGYIDIDEVFLKKHNFGRVGKYAYISVSDTGIGMDEETKANIFNPFFTTKEVGKGTGLGLSIVYGIVKQHSGYITVETAPGKGSTFTVFIPVANKEKEEEKVYDKFEFERGSETILICEDDDGVRSFMEEILKGAGYNVLTARDGVESIEMFNRYANIIDLIILDIIMPKKNGIEVYEEIKTIRPDIEALFISGYPRDSLEKRGKTFGGMEIIAKPITPQKLLKSIRARIDNKKHK